MGGMGVKRGATSRVTRLRPGLVYDEIAQAHTQPVDRGKHGNPPARRDPVIGLGNNARPSLVRSQHARRKVAKDLAATLDGAFLKLAVRAGVSRIRVKEG